MYSTLSKHRSQLEAIIWECSHAQWKSESHNFWDKILVVSSCTSTQRNETLTNCVTTPCMDMKTIGIPPCTSTPGQPHSPRGHYLVTILLTRSQSDPGLKMDIVCFRKWIFLRMAYWKKKVSNSKFLYLKLWQISHNSSIFGYQDMMNGLCNLPLIKCSLRKIFC